MVHITLPLAMKHGIPTWSNEITDLCIETSFPALKQVHLFFVGTHTMQITV